MIRSRVKDRSTRRAKEKRKTKTGATLQHRATALRDHNKRSYPYSQPRTLAPPTPADPRLTLSILLGEC